MLNILKDLLAFDYQQDYSEFDSRGAVSGAL